MKKVLRIIGIIMAVLIAIPVILAGFEPKLFVSLVDEFFIKFIITRKMIVVFFIFII